MTCIILNPNKNKNNSVAQEYCVTRKDLLVVVVRKKSSPLRLKTKKSKCRLAHILASLHILVYCIETNYETKILLIFSVEAVCILHSLQS